jgi:hypothetical protein
MLPLTLLSHVAVVHLGHPALACDQLLHRMSHVTCHTSHVTRHTSHVTRHTSHVARHTSHVTRHTSHVTRHTSHVTRHTSHVTRRASPAAASKRTSCGRACRTLHRPAAQLGWLGMLRAGVTLKGGSSKSHVTRHTSHVTRHTSHVTSSTSPSMNVCSPSMASSCTRSSSILSPRALQKVTVFLCGKRN